MRKGNFTSIALILSIVSLFLIVSMKKREKKNTDFDNQYTEFRDVHVLKITIISHDTFDAEHKKSIYKSMYHSIQYDDITHKIYLE